MNSDASLILVIGVWGLMFAGDPDLADALIAALMR